MSAARRRDRRGFTLPEVVVVIVILGVLASVAIPAYVSMTKQAESSNVEYMAGSLTSALNINSSKLLTSGGTIASHNPFADLATPPDNYAGAFGDVDLTNCQPGQWAYQSGNASNGNWPVVVYRPKSTLTTAFTWGGAQWLVYQVNTVTGPTGNVVGLTLAEYPPLHQW
ncbi:MAG TPA: prepilin-type N-terminal cleavage/methylation domain-containing protein [Candidatus Saccharimonadales bacterium]|nr:prepilin-type N-terminal cleavage/methylation domain-containing protein [Candidatus Saccharimonadales bacterium]